LDIDVSVYLFLGCIYSWLTSPDLKRSENLIFKNIENLSYASPLNINVMMELILRHHTTCFGKRAGQKMLYRFHQIFSDGTIIDKADIHSFEPYMFNHSCLFLEYSHRSGKQNLWFGKI